MDELLFVRSHKTLPQSLTYGLSGASLCFGSGFGGEEDTHHQFKSPQNRLPRLLLSESVHSPLNPPFHYLPTSSHARTHTETIHMHHTHGTQTATRAVLPGTLRECRRRAPGLAGDPITTPPRAFHFPLPAATIASSFIHLTLCFSERNRAPGLASAASQCSQSTPRPCVRGTGGRSQPPGSRLRRLGPGRTCGMSLIRDSRYRRNSINLSALSVRPPAGMPTSNVGGTNGLSQPHQRGGLALVG